MEFRDLHAQYNALQDDIDRAINSVLASGRFIGGEAVTQLERELKDYVGVKHCITCGNGTDALQLALMAWGIGPGDAVIVPDFTFFSSGEVVSAVGATPVFVDVLEDTFNLDPAQIEPAVKLAKASGLNPRVVVAVDLFGQPADYLAIRKECEKFDLLLLEDGAQAQHDDDYPGDGEQRADSRGYGESHRYPDDPEHDVERRSQCLPYVQIHPSAGHDVLFPITMYRFRVSTGEGLIFKNIDIRRMRRIGSLEVSPIGIGCMGFSHGYGEIPSEEYSVETIRMAYDHGCTFFDTAEIYSPELAGIGHNERIVGRALE